MILSINPGSVISRTELQKESERHRQRIEEIKEEVAGEWDNLTNPVPFLTVPVYEEME